MKATQIRAIADVGSAVSGAVRHAEDASTVLSPLRAIASFDAAMIAVRDPLSGHHRPIVNQGYEASLLGFINTEYLSCYSYGVARACGRPMRMRDYGPNFYRTRVYREFLDAAGFHEGVTLVLRSGDRRRVTGLMTMSFTEAHAADQAARQGLDLVAPMLGQLVDACLTPAWLADLIAPGSAAFVIGEGEAMVAVSGTGASAGKQPSAAAIAVARAFLSTNAHSLRGYCARSEDASWERVHLLRLTDEARVDGPRALLMLREEPLPCALTDRELDVLTLVARGLSNRAVGGALRVSSRTVGSHIEHVLLKTGLVNRAALASYAMQHGVIRLGL